MCHCESDIDIEMCTRWGRVGIKWGGHYSVRVGIDIEMYTRWCGVGIRSGEIFVHVVVGIRWGPLVWRLAF